MTLPSLNLYNQITNDASFSKILLLILSLFTNNVNLVYYWIVLSQNFIVKVI